MKLASSYLGLFLIVSVMLSCAKRNVVETPPPPPPPPAAEKLVEEKKAPVEEVVEIPLWRQVSMRDLPDLEPAVDRDYVGSVWLLERPAELEAALNGEPAPFTLPAPSGIKDFMVESGEGGSWSVTSADGRCSGNGSGNASTFRFEMTCTDVTYTLEPMLQGSESYYAVVKKD